MNSIDVNKSANGEAVRLAYQDLGNGRPVILIHGWPASHAMWEYQLLELPNHGMRVIAYDRRGFGHSSKPWEGYDYDTLADDLHGLIEGLDLREVAHIGDALHRAPAAGLDRRDGLVEVRHGAEWVADGLDRVVADVQRDDVGAFVREPEGVRAPLAASGPGDERHLAFEQPHVRPLPCEQS